MASFIKYQTKSGEMWMFKMEIGIDPATGKRKSTTRRGFKRKKDAELAAAELLRGIQQGEVRKADMTFEEVFQEWYREHKKTLKPSTQYSKESKFKKHILPNFAKLKMKDITAEYCQQFINRLAEEMAAYRDYAVQTNLVFKYAMKMDYIFRNPMDKVSYPVDEDQHYSDEEFCGFWEKDVMLSFLKQAEQEMTFRNYAMFYVLLFTGIRKGELLALQEDDVNQKTRELMINKTLMWKSNDYILLTPKTKNSRRVIKLDQDCFEIISKLIRYNKELRMRLGKLDVPKFLFPRSDLRPLRSAYPNEALQSACKRYGIENITVHGLRHTHASMLFAAGVRMKDVQKRLGHSRLQTTMDIYTHVTKESDADTSEMLANYMAK